MRRFLFVFLSGLVVTGCASKEVDPAYFRAIKELRPEGYGATNYGLAVACKPGTCASAQREYHGKYLQVRDAYGVLTPPIWTPLMPYAEAVAARVDNGEISPAQAEALIQELRARITIEAERLRAMNAQVDAINWAAFWQSYTTSIQMTRPINCTTTYLGTLATTRCY